MSWNDSIFNDDRGKWDRWQNRDSDTHMHVFEDLHYTREDITPVRELTNWEKDYVESVFMHEPDLEQ